MKLNLVAIKGIASKLHSQMEPGYSSTFKNGTLPILSIAQIDKAVKQKLGVKNNVINPTSVGGNYATAALLQNNRQSQ